LRLKTHHQLSNRMTLISLLMPPFHFVVAF
jgi:hypothetical protein